MYELAAPFAKVVGSFGTTATVAPTVLYGDAVDDPLALTACTVTSMRVPYVRVKGAAQKRLMGIEQVLAVTIAFKLPSQLVVSV